MRAPALAVELLLLALATSRPSDALVSMLPLHHARALLWAGRPADAEQAAREALARLDTSISDTQLRWLLAHACLQQGNVVQAVAESELALASTTLDPRMAARLHGFQAQARLLLGRVFAADAAAICAVEAAQANDDAYGLAYGFYIRGSVKFLEQRHEEGLVFADSAMAALAGRSSQPDLQMVPRLMRGSCLMELGRTAEAEIAIQSEQRECERRSSVFLTWNHLTRARLSYLCGRWDDASTEIQAGLDAVDPLGGREGLRSQAALIAMHRGDFTTYDDIVARPDTGLLGLHWDYLRVAAKALACEGKGDLDGALQELLAFWVRSVDLTTSRYKLNHLCMDLARLSSMVGQSAAFPSVHAVLADSMALNPALAIRGIAAFCRGVDSSDVAALGDAATLFEQADRPFERAYVLEHSAVLLAGDQQLSKAETALAGALELFESLDACWDADRATARLRRVGVRRASTRHVRQPSKDSLTGTEHRVAVLVSAGRSTADIAGELTLSRRTVQNHISNILAKLGLSSRIELVAAYRELTGVPPGRP